MLADFGAQLDRQFLHLGAARRADAMRNASVARSMFERRTRCQPKTKGPVNKRAFPTKAMGKFQASTFIGDMSASRLKPAIADSPLSAPELWTEKRPHSGR